MNPNYKPDGAFKQGLIELGAGFAGGTAIGGGIVAVGGDTRVAYAVMATCAVLGGIRGAIKGHTASKEVAERNHVIEEAVSHGRMQVTNQEVSL